jgi:hypothetical protein
MHHRKNDFAELPYDAYFEILVSGRDIHWSVPGKYRAR